MGTRATTLFISKARNGELTNLLKLYRQMDGYPSGWGVELADFLSSKKLVNGYTDKNQFNGIGCLVAQVIAEFKSGVGNLYISPLDSKDAWIDYHYDVIVPDNLEEEIMLICSDSNGIIYNGIVSKFSEFIEQKPESEEE